jgi:hypothetical protein
MKSTIFIILTFLGCHFKDNAIVSKEIENSNTKLKYQMEMKQIDSLKNLGYLFAKKIDFFTLTPLDIITSPSNDDISFYAIKKEKNIIYINVISYGQIIDVRKLNKLYSSYYVEERIIDSSDGGEIHYLTYYYSNTKIIVSEVTKNIFQKDESKINSYFSRLFIITKSNVVEYNYILNNSFHLKKNIKLNGNQLENINEIALSLFYNKDNVDIYNFPFTDLKKEVLYLWEMNDLGN